MLSSLLSPVNQCNYTSVEKQVPLPTPYKKFAKAYEDQAGRMRLVAYDTAGAVAGLLLEKVGKRTYQIVHSFAEQGKDTNNFELSLLYLARCLCKHVKDNEFTG